jgi:signal peptidase I
MSEKIYSLTQSRKIMKASYAWYQKKRSELSQGQLHIFEADLAGLDKALLSQHKDEASLLAKRLESFCRLHFKKGIWSYTWEICAAILFALVVATLIRQVWFELYEIPTGSMRPTFQEQDHLTVSKTAFAINWPLETKHLYFDPNLVQRTSVFVWSGDHIPYLNSNTTYMGIFPYTKRYIKRCLGKPGDTLYFYGGKIYGYDRDGSDLVDLRDNPWMTKLEYLPFMTFEGRSSAEGRANAFQVVFRQMNIPIGRITITPTGDMRGEVFTGKEWIDDNNSSLKKPHTTIQAYSDFWGMGNFAMARLLTKDQVENLTSFNPKELPEGMLYLELRHTPSLTNPKPKLVEQQSNRYSLVLNPFTTLIPLEEHHLKVLMENMYTARFIIEKGRGARYSEGKAFFSAASPPFIGVPDGTYEFYYGKACQINWGGIHFPVPADSPLYSLELSNIQKLFNIGIDLSNYVEPRSKEQLAFPNRYAYFRDGDLCLLGAPILKKDDPALLAFHAREQKRSVESSYVAFNDHGAPIKNGKLDKEFIKSFGLKIPDGHYLALGDNHAMSQDSRAFGFIPQANIQGAPWLILWPPGDRFGYPAQKPYPWINLPSLVIWSIALGIIGTWYVWHRYRIKQPIYKKL